jgi:acyl-coenzyme A thioesterase PaaI-like protein
MNPTQENIERAKREVHSDCIGCGLGNASGLALRFCLRADKGVEAEFSCSKLYQGYPGFLHGGITSLLLDSAMTNCLFAHHIIAVTARLIIRFISPVNTGQPISVKAWLREYEPPLYVLESEIEQNGKVLVRASAKFIDRDLAMENG